MTHGKCVVVYLSAETLEGYFILFFFVCVCVAVVWMLLQTVHRVRDPDSIETVKRLHPCPSCLCVWRRTRFHLHV